MSAASIRQLWLCRLLAAVALALIGATAGRRLPVLHRRVAHAHRRDQLGGRGRAGQADRRRPAARRRRRTMKADSPRPIPTPARRRSKWSTCSAARTASQAGQRDQGRLLRRRRARQDVSHFRHRRRERAARMDDARCRSPRPRSTTSASCPASPRPAPTAWHSSRIISRTTIRSWPRMPTTNLPARRIPSCTN